MIKKDTNLLDKPLDLETNALTDEIKSIQKLLIPKKWKLQALTLLIKILVI